MKQTQQDDDPSEIITDMVRMYDKLKFKQDIMMALNMLFGVCIIYIFWLLR